MESKNFNFKINQKKLSRERIEKHMDFDKLLAQFDESEQNNAPVFLPRKKPEARFRIMPFASAAAAVLAGVMFYFTFIYNGKSDVQKYFEDQQAFAIKSNFNTGINPPHKNIKPQFTSYKMKADKGGKINLKRSTLSVPPAAFVNNAGESVTGEIEFKYLEHLDFVDFYISGIPMHYDSLSNRYLLESAGMIELYAEQDGERINISPGKFIQVEFKSEIVCNVNQKPDLNVYKLDEKTTNWVYKGADDLEILSTTELENDAAAKIKSTYEARLIDLKNIRDRKIAEIEATIPLPVKPSRQSPSMANVQSFDLDFLGVDFFSGMEETEELKAMKKHANMVWTSSNGQVISNEDADRVWDDYKLEQLSENKFQLTLFSGDKILRLHAQPVVHDGVSDESFDTKLRAYREAVADRDLKLKADKTAVLDDYKKRTSELEKSMQKQLLDLKKNPDSAPKLVRYKVINRFKVDQLGIWNCDRLAKHSISKLKARFIDSNNVKHDLNTAFIVNKNKNTIKRHYTKNGSPLPIDKDEDNLMWLITEDNKIAVFSPEEFKSIESKKGDHTFIMKVIDKNIQSKEDVREILQKL